MTTLLDMKRDRQEPGGSSVAGYKLVPLAESRGSTMLWVVRIELKEEQHGLADRLAVHQSVIITPI